MQNKKLQIIGFIIIQDKNDEISDSTSIGTALVILNMSKIQLGYIIAKKKIEKNCSLHSFSTQMLKFSLFFFVDKDSLYTHN